MCEQLQQSVSSCPFITTRTDTAQVFVCSVNTTVIFLGAAICQGPCTAWNKPNVTVYVSQGYHLS